MISITFLTVCEAARGVGRAGGVRPGSWAGRSQGQAGPGALTDVGPLAGPGVDRYDDAALEDEPQGGGTVVGFHVLDDLALEGVDLRSQHTQLIPRPVDRPRVDPTRHAEPHAHVCDRWQREAGRVFARELRQRGACGRLGSQPRLRLEHGQVHLHHGAVLRCWPEGQRDRGDGLDACLLPAPLTLEIWTVDG